VAALPDPDAYQAGIQAVASTFLAEFASAGARGFSAAAAAWGALRDCGLRPTATAANAWLRALVAASKASEALAVFDRLMEPSPLPRGTGRRSPHRQLQPDGDTLAIVVDACSQLVRCTNELFDICRFLINKNLTHLQSDFGRARAYWKQLTGARSPRANSIPPGGVGVVRPTLASYNAFMAAAAQCGHRREALHALHRMRRAGVAPDADSYAAAMLACGYSDAPHRAFSLHADMAAAGVAPTEASCHALMLVAGMAADADPSLVGEALAVLEDAADPALWQSARLVTATAGAGQAVGDPDLVRHVWNRLRLQCPEGAVAAPPDDWLAAASSVLEAGANATIRAVTSGRMDAHAALAHARFWSAEARWTHAQRLRSQPVQREQPEQRELEHEQRGHRELPVDVAGALLRCLALCQKWAEVKQLLADNVLPLQVNEGEEAHPRAVAHAAAVIRCCGLRAEADPLGAEAQLE
jgi:pentatricopeptide repeat protein